MRITLSVMNLTHPNYYQHTKYIQHSKNKASVKGLKYEIMTNGNTFDLKIQTHVNSLLS